MLTYDTVLPGIDFSKNLFYFEVFRLLIKSFFVQVFRDEPHEPHEPCSDVRGVYYRSPATM